MIIMGIIIIGHIEKAKSKKKEKIQVFDLKKKIYSYNLHVRIVLYSILLLYCLKLYIACPK